MGAADVVPSDRDAKASKLRDKLVGEERPAPAEQDPPPPTLDAVLQAIRTAQTPDDMTAAAAKSAQLPDSADKEIARKAYGARMKELRDAAAGPTFAEIADKINAAQSAAELEVAADLIRGVRNDEQRDELTALRARRADELAALAAGGA